MIINIIKKIKIFRRLRKYKICFLIIIIIHFIFYKIFPFLAYRETNKIIKVALCTMGKKENLYAKEFIDYYLKLGVDHIFIYDNNEPFTEKIGDILEIKYKDKVSIYDTQKFNISNQPEAYTFCYQNNLKLFDWFIMVDIDEYLYIVDDSLKGYLSNHVFDKCDFIKINWVNALDNNLLYSSHYENKIKFTFIKIMKNIVDFINFDFK